MRKPDTMNRSFRRWQNVAVIGGGPAGSATAIRLRQHGVDVTLFERRSFPREKTCGCCVARPGQEALDRLGCLAAVKAQARPLHRWVGSIDGHTTVIPLFGHLAISRSALDGILIHRAAALGAVIRQPATATVSWMDESQVGLLIEEPNQPTRPLAFDGVVLATGLSSPGLDNWLPLTRASSGPFGVCYHLDLQDRFPRDAIGMACDADGYVGLVALENGRLDIAAALQRGRSAARRGRPNERVRDILRRARWPDGLELSTALNDDSVSLVGTTPLLRRRRLAGFQRLLAVGDAACYEEPFTGQGMTWAMIGAMGAADWIQTASRAPADLGQGWPFQLRRLLHPEMKRCRWISLALRNRVSRRLMGYALANFPGLSQPVVRVLNRPLTAEAVPAGDSA